MRFGPLIKAKNDIGCRLSTKSYNLFAINFFTFKVVQYVPRITTSRYLNQTYTKIEFPPTEMTIRTRKINAPEISKNLKKSFHFMALKQRLFSYMIVDSTYF